MLDQMLIRLTILLASSYPLSLFYTLFLKSSLSTTKHIYSCVTSMLLFTSLFNVTDFFQPILMSTVVYLMVKFRIGIAWVFAWCMGLLCSNHLYVMLYTGGSKGRFDATAPLMVLVIKLTSFACEIHDRRLKNIEKESVDNELPSIIEFSGYIFFFGGFFVGPAIRFNDYMDFIHERPPFNNIPSKAKYIASAKCFIATVTCFTLFVNFSDAFNYKVMTEDHFIEETSFFYKILFLWLSGFIARSKYYAAWKLSEGACILSGFGYTSEGNFNRVTNVNILNFEFAENARAAVENWNIQTAKWLKKDVYLRLAGYKFFSPALLTFIVSSVWHGFHPGYYLFFLTASLMNKSAKLARRHLRPLIMHYKAFYDAAGIMMMSLTLNYMAAPFEVLTMRKSFKILSSVGFYIHLLMIGWVATALVLFKNTDRNRMKQKVSVCKKEE